MLQVFWEWSVVEKVHPASDVAKSSISNAILVLEFATESTELATGSCVFLLEFSS